MALLNKAGGFSLTNLLETLYVDDVFSTYLYDGTSSAQTINNGIDLAGQGGLVWLKNRTASTSHLLFDTTRGLSPTFGTTNPQYLDTSSTLGNENTTTNYIKSNADGFSFGSDATGVSANASGNSYVSWTFRKAPKFFDVVTYTGNGVAGRTVAHSLGSTPGMIFVKSLGTATNGGSDGFWFVYHRSLSTPQSSCLFLNSTDAINATATWNNTLPTETQFSVDGGSLTNINGRQYVAYLFAHDPDPTGLIQCGSYTTDGSGNATVNLGWEPQWLLWKGASTTSSWQIQDNLRGFPSGPGIAYLLANSPDAENTFNGVGVNAGGLLANGFTLGAQGAGNQTYVYMAIRRPNKPPVTGAQVFEVLSTNKDQVTLNVIGNITPDTAIFHPIQASSGNHHFYDRLRGNDRPLYSNSTDAETGLPGTLCVFNRIQKGLRWGDFNPYYSGKTHLFRRAPGFFDQVCYTGTGASRTVPHSLGVVPEMMIVKSRGTPNQGGGDGFWFVYHQGLTTPQSSVVFLNTTDARNSAGSWNNTSPTSTIFSVGSGASPDFTSISGREYVAYLFASAPGISKVGSYTGNGTSQTINCGFSTGARFVLIKRTDAAGDWYVWDTARGIVAGNDPHLSLNSTAAEVTTDDSIDPATTGFIVNQVAATNINVSAATYIFFAIA